MDKIIVKQRFVSSVGNNIQQLMDLSAELPQYYLSEAPCVKVDNGTWYTYIFVLKPWYKRMFLTK